MSKRSGDASGWVGAGVIALGIGAALASAPAVAYADDGAGDAGTSESSTSSPAKSPTGPAKRAKVKRSDADADVRRGRIADRAVEAKIRPESVTRQIRSRVQVRQELSDSVRGRAAFGSARGSRGSAVEDGTAASSIALPTDLGRSQRNSPAAVERSATVEAPAAVSGAATTLETVDTRVSVPKVSVKVLDAPEPAAPPVSRTLVVSLLSALGYNPTATGPSAPVNPNPLLVGLWGLYRRVEAVVANEAPTAGTPTVTGSSLVEGQPLYSGTLGFTDFNDDELSYQVVEGAQHGTVTANADGTFTYAPTDPEFKGIDTFSIAARDNALFGANVTTVSYRVSVGGAVTQIALPTGTTPRGTAVVDPVRGVVYQTSEYVADGPGRGVVVTEIGPDGIARTITSTPLAGSASGGAVVNPVTGALYQVTVQDTTSTVHIIDPTTGSVTSTRTLAGTSGTELVIDADTGVAYLTAEQGVYLDEVTTTVYIIGPDGSAAGSETLGGASNRELVAAGGVVIHPDTGTVYQTITHDEQTTIWIVRSDGSVQQFAEPIAGNASGGVVIDAAGNLYQTTDVTGGVDVTLMDKTDGDVLQRWHTSGNAAGGVVIDAAGHVYQTSDGFYGDALTTWATVVERLNPDGTTTWLTDIDRDGDGDAETLVLPGHATEPVLINPVNGALLQITDWAYTGSGARWSFTITNVDGPDTLIPISVGLPERTAAIDPVSGRVYQSSWSLDDSTSSTSHQLTAIDIDGSHHVVLAGLPDGYVYGVAVDPASGDVYVTTDSGLWVIAGDATGGEHTLPDVIQA
ncbi:hypothetical protein FR943_06060 [Mycobacterium sp. TNTM28]|uniref:SMP-30/Gluconolactonase/LRE-like region domain-containing protein n=1 Tax=[Mycobacterium] fortunisiensis TaxID=2600579 RepID=A0ABS6KII6_9MYCO|nr:Ig-like domain-containing protein [[Mycobacterium] fortunisiensis]MBU9763407.1 hypothetical protein [[Mycobacterium] fortunisiensis]